MSVAADDVARRNCGCYGLFGNLGLGVFTSEFNHRQFSHGRSFPCLTIPGHVEGDVCLNSGMLDIGRVSLSICLGAYGDGADVAVAILRHLTDFDRVPNQIHRLSSMSVAADDVARRNCGCYGLLGLVVLADQPPLCAVERVSGAEAEAVVRLSKDAQTVVERIAEAVGRDRFKVHAVFGHVNVAAALGHAHVLGGNNDLLGQFDQLLHGLRQFLHLLRVGKNLHIIVPNVVAPVIGCYVFVENSAQVLIQSVFVIKALLREITENLGQQVILGVDACAGEHGIIVGDRGEGGGIEECEQLTDVLAGLCLAARLGNGQRAILVPRQLQQFADVVEESVPLHRLPAGKIAV